jgi:hypothetical protein
MSIIRLTTCDTAVEANLIKGRLKNEDIETFITNENFSNLMPHYNRILNSGIQIMISDIDYDRASEILELNIKQEPICPNCQSVNIKFSLGKNKIRKIIVIIISLFIATPFNNLKSVNKCQDCQTEF